MRCSKTPWRSHPANSDDRNGKAQLAPHGSRRRRCRDPVHHGAPRGLPGGVLSGAVDGRIRQTLSGESSMASHAVGVGRHAGAHPPRARRGNPRARGQRGEPERGNHRQPDRTFRQSRRACRIGIAYALKCDVAAPPGVPSCGINRMGRMPYSSRLVRLAGAPPS